MLYSSSNPFKNWNKCCSFFCLLRVVTKVAIFSVMAFNGAQVVKGFNLLPKSAHSSEIFTYGFSMILELIHLSVQPIFFRAPSLSKRSFQLLPHNHSQGYEENGFFFFLFLNTVISIQYETVLLHVSHCSPFSTFVGSISKVPFTKSNFLYNVKMISIDLFILYDWLK